MVSKDPDYRPNVLQLLSDPSVKCYSWVNLFKDWREYLRSKGLLVFNNVQNICVFLTTFSLMVLKSLICKNLRYSIDYISCSYSL